jgi:hypothetical protein
MTRKLNRNYSLIVVVASVAILALLIAAAVRAQTPSTDRPSGQANAVLAQTGASAPAQAERPLTPNTDGAGRFPVGRSHAKPHGANPMDANPLFLPEVTYDSGGTDYVFLDGSGSVAVADVNGDGKLDIVVLNTQSSTIGVLLGKGD